MRKIYLYCLLLLVTVIISCGKKTDKDRAIKLVEAKYENGTQKPDFENAKLDSLYNISPKAYDDSVKKGNELDVTLAKLESEIEHLSQAESDSVGLISARLTKERYRLLELAKTKSAFIGWRLSGVRIDSELQNFDFDKSITKLVD